MTDTFNTDKAAAIQASLNGNSRGKNGYEPTPLDPSAYGIVVPEGKILVLGRNGKPVIQRAPTAMPTEINQGPSMPIITPRTFYTPTPGERGNPDIFAVPSHLDSSTQFNRFVEQCLTPFKENKDLSGEAEDRIEVFTDGAPPYSPIATTVEYEEIDAEGKKVKKAADNRQNRDAFVGQMRGVAARYAGDFIGLDGRVSQDKQQAWENLTVIGPALIGILTDRDNQIAYIHEAHVLNTVAAALELANDPTKQIVYRIGIGGSDDSETNLLFPSYGLPAMNVADKMLDFYDDRTKRKLLKTATDRRVARHEEKFGPLTNEQKKRIRELSDAQKQITRAEAKYGPLTPIQQEAFIKRSDPERIIARFIPDQTERKTLETKIKETAGIASDPIKVEFVYAYHAAEVNGKEPQKVEARVAEQMAYLEWYLIRFHPRVADRTQYLTDTPWSLPSLADVKTWDDALASKETGVPLQPYYLLAVREYLADSLRNSDDPSIKKTIKILEQLGNSNGGEDGKQKAVEYATIHPLVFDDLLNIPRPVYIDGEIQAPEMIFTGGGEAERHFTAAREYASQTASARDFAQFLDGRIVNLIEDWMEGDPDQRTANMLKISQYTIIEQMLLKKEDASAEYPLHSVPQITRHEEPPYYFGPYDAPMGGPERTDINTFITDRSAILTQLKADERVNPDPQRALTIYKLERKLRSALIMQADMAKHG